MGMTARDVKALWRSRNHSEDKLLTATETILIRSALEAHGLDRVPADWPASLTRVTEDDVRRALARPMAPFTPERLQVFLSPAADALLEAMARAAQAVTRQRFGNAIGLYAPLYLSNVCINRCVYCGFNAAHAGARRRLTVEEALADARVIAAEGFGDILLVAGEDPEYVTLEYLCEIVRALRDGPKPLFSSVSVEIEPLGEDAYRRLFEAGVDGVTLYQETYDRDTYARYHLSGPKAGYEARLVRQEAAARAGMRRLGIGALLGLQDWRYETLALGVHAHTLMKHFWRSKVSVSFPRMRPAPDVRIDIPHPVSDRQMVQMMLALRLCFADIGLVLSTRESAGFRNHALPLGITQMSAGSRTNPGGYTASDDAETEQFSVADTRSAREVADYLVAHGYDPVWKDWDAGFHG